MRLNIMRYAFIYSSSGTPDWPKYQHKSYCGQLPVRHFSPIHKKCTSCILFSPCVLVNFLNEIKSAYF
jgi:hypothetical protein